jgi:hypothetical protein
MDEWQVDCLVDGEAEDDMFLYEQGSKFQSRVPALKHMFESVAGVEGVDYVSLTHGTIAPATFNPSVIGELSPVAVGKSPNRHESSTHPDKRYAMMFVGLETGSVRLFKQYMKGKSYRFAPSNGPM